MISASIRTGISKTFFLLFLLCSTLLSPSLVLAQQEKEQEGGSGSPPTIYTDTDGNDLAGLGYRYHGCYNETTDVEGTSGGTRALYNGKNEYRPGEMTVQRCLRFCGEGEVKYKFAGLEYAKECWCAQQLLSISPKLDDKECNLPCDGDQTQICGGALKLTVYIAAGSPRLMTTLNAAWAVGLAGIMGLGLSL